MDEYKGKKTGGGGIPWRIIGWGATAFLLVLPLVTNAPWTLSDYIMMAALLGGAGLLIELAVRASGSLAFRAGAGIAVLAAFLLIWVNLAVGLLGSEDNPANLMFFGVLAVALIGSLAVRFSPAGMVKVMMATAVAQLLVGLAAYAGNHASPGSQGTYELVTGTALFGALWLISAALFRKAASQRGSAA